MDILDESRISWHMSRLYLTGKPHYHWLSVFLSYCDLILILYIYVCVCLSVYMAEFFKLRLKPIRGLRNVLSGLQPVLKKRQQSKRKQCISHRNGSIRFYDFDFTRVYMKCIYVSDIYVCMRCLFLRVYYTFVCIYIDVHICTCVYIDLLLTFTQEYVCVHDILLCCACATCFYLSVWYIRVYVL